MLEGKSIWITRPAGQAESLVMSLEESGARPSLLPMLAITLAPVETRIPLTFAASLVALALTGGVGAYLGQSPLLRPILRVTAGGALALALTWGIGLLLGGETAL